MKISMIGKTGSDMRLSLLKSIPDSIGAFQRQGALQAFPGCFSSEAGSDALEEAPQRRGRKHEASKSIGQENRKGAATAPPPVPVAAEKPASADLLFPAVFAVSSQESMSDEETDGSTMRANFLLELHSILIELIEVATVVVAFRGTHNMQVLLAEPVYYAFFLLNEKRAEESTGLNSKGGNFVVGDGTVRHVP